MAPTARATTSETIGVFGGSFDPPHAGHVLLVTYVLSASELDRVLVIPTWQHPLGKSSRASYEHRVRMCELALRDLRRVEVSRIEQELGGASRTLRTLEELGRRLSGAQLRLMVGADLLAETPRWHRWDRIEQLAPPLVVGREGSERHDDLALDMPEVSSTLLRERLRRGEPTRGLLPRAVERYIAAQGLYG